MSGGFWKADPQAWLDVIAPWLEGDSAWPLAVAREDLRWMADQVDTFGRVLLRKTDARPMTRVPGRELLCARWRLSDRVVRGLLIEVNPAPERARPRRPASVQEASSERPASVQEASRTDAPERRQSSESVQEASSERPASVQEASSERPHARSRQNHRAQSTEHRAQETIPGLPAPDEPPPAGVTARRLLSEQAAPVFAAYRAHHPQKPPHPTAREKKAIEDRLREVVATRGQRTTDAEAVASAGLALIAIVEWAHEAPDAEFYREKKALGLESPLLKADKFADRLERALAWHAAGRPLARGSPASARASPSTGGSWMDDLRAFREPEKPPRKRIDPDHPLPEEPPWPM